MDCNSMQLGGKFNQYLLQQQPEPSSCSSDSVLSCKKMSCDTDMDILLANAGYDVKSSDLAHVAQRLEQLEFVLSAAQDAGISHLSSEAVHYNPSDLAGWIECMIGELAPTSLDGGGGGGGGGLGGGGGGGEYQLQPPLSHMKYAAEDDYEFFNMGSCSVDQASPSQQLDTRGSFVEAKQSNSMMLQPSTESISSVSQFAIGQQGVSAVNRPRYDAKDYSGMVMLDEMGDFQQYKIVEDQASSNQMESFYPNAADQCREAMFPVGFNVQQHSIPTSSSMSSLKQPPTSQEHRTYPQHMQHQMRQPRDLKSAAPTSSHRSNRRAPYPDRQHVHHHHQHPPRQQEVRQQDVKIIANASPSTMSTTSPMMPFQEHGSAHDKKSPFAHSQQQPNKFSGSQFHAHQPVVYADVSEEGAQESGIRLVHVLMACAEAIQNNELAAALDMVREIKRLASSNSGAMGKVANHFVEALARRICGANMEDRAFLSQADALSELLYSNFYETCPYLKFAHFTANQAILEAFEGHKFVHVIDFNLLQGLQWPALIQALALRPGGPPHLRMTGIGPPQPDNKDVLQEIGLKLAHLAGSVNVEFSFRGVVATKLDDVEPWMLEVKQGEAIAVNSILQLHQLLYGPNPNVDVAPINEVLKSVKSLNPKIVTLVEQEASHNSPSFLERFVEALHYYCTMFDSLEACCLPPQCHELACTEMYLGREIVNIVACEGLSRIERHEPLSQWRQRMLNAGFRPLHLGSNAFKQASMLLTLFSGEGYTVEENKGCLTLGWHSRPLIAASAWQCG